MVQDLDTAKREFWAAVRHLNPKRTDVERTYAPILDRLIAWSNTQPRLRFTWHTGKPGSERQSLVKYCVEGMEDEGAFWAVYPKQKDVAFLIVLADANARFPEDLRRDALRELAALDGRSDDPGTYPRVYFANLTLSKLEDVLKLMEGWLPRVLAK
jgi:hypothetical protein